MNVYSWLPGYSRCLLNNSQRWKNGPVRKLHRVLNLQAVPAYFWKCSELEKDVITGSHRKEYFMWLEEVLSWGAWDGSSVGCCADGETTVLGDTHCNCTPFYSQKCPRLQAKSCGHPIQGSCSSKGQWSLNHLLGQRASCRALVVLCGGCKPGAGMELLGSSRRGWTLPLAYFSM